mgnify:CR=1 FL=1
MITRRLFGTLAGMAPVFGKEVAKAVVEVPPTLPGPLHAAEFGSFISVPGKMIKKDEGAVAARELTRKVGKLRGLIEQAKKYAEGSSAVEFPDQQIHFDMDLLTNRSFSLAAAEHIQMQRYRERKYHGIITALNRSFEETFGMPLDFDKLKRGEYTSFLDGVLDGSCKLPEPKPQPINCEDENAEDASNECDPAVY